MAMCGQLLGLGCYFYPTYDEGGECRVHRDPWTVVLLSNVLNIVAPGAIGSEHYVRSLVRIEYEDRLGFVSFRHLHLPK